MSTWKSITRSSIYKRLPTDSAVRVYLRIMRAAQLEQGVLLSPEETYSCSLDHAVMQAAISAVEEDEDFDSGPFS